VIACPLLATGNDQHTSSADIGKQAPEKTDDQCERDALTDETQTQFQAEHTWVKLAPNVEAINPSKIRNVAAAPTSPPIAASTSDSKSVPRKAERR
jgi:hypothetical protein